MHQQSKSHRTSWKASANGGGCLFRILCVCLAGLVGFGVDNLWAQTSTPRSSSLIPAAVSPPRGSAELQSLLGEPPPPSIGLTTTGHILPGQQPAPRDTLTAEPFANAPTDAHDRRGPSPAQPVRDNNSINTPAESPISLPTGSPPRAGLTVAQPVAHQLESTVTLGAVSERHDPLHEQLPGPSGMAEERLGRRDGSSSGLGVGGQSLLQTGVALAFVLALVFGCAWLLRKAGPKSLQPLPLEAVQLLGNAPLYGKQHLRLIRMGQRVLLLAVSETSTQTLTEVTDPTEVGQLLELCQSSHPQGHAKTFEALLRESGRERASGFLGSQQDQVPTALRRTRSTDAASAMPRESSDGRVAARPASNHFFEA